MGRSCRSVFLSLAKLYRENGSYQVADEAEKLADLCSKNSRVYHGFFGFFLWMLDDTRTIEETEWLKEKSAELLKGYLKEFENTLPIALKH